MTKILLVDDETSVLNLLKMSLEFDGYEVITAENGLSALAVFQEQQPEIAVLDARMPEMDGLELLTKIKSMRSDTEVIMITDHSDMNMAINCLRKEASNFLTKPVSEDLLSLSIKRSVEKLNLKKKLKRCTENLENLSRETNDELEWAYRFRVNIIENSPDAIVCVKKGGDIIIFNSAAEKLLGYKKEDVIGKMNIVSLYPPNVAKEIMKDLRSEGFGGEGVIEKREIEVFRKGGRPIPVYISAAILYEGSQESGSVGIFSRSEKFSSLGQLSAGIAHAINEPFIGVVTYASLLLKKFKDDEETGKAMAITIPETERIRNLIHGILNFAHEVPVKKKLHSINESLNKTLEVVSHQQHLVDVHLSTDFDFSIPDVFIDENLMRQVFINLALNAVEAMKGCGTLTIRTRSAGNYVEVDFHDSGRGLPEEIVVNIFDPFFSTKGSSEGSGIRIGLSISYDIVRNHGGEIMVSSILGQGTTFTVRLPVENKFL